MSNPNLVTPIDSQTPGESEIQQALARFGHSSFRPGQREALDTLFDRGQLLLVAPTGGARA